MYSPVNFIFVLLSGINYPNHRSIPKPCTLKLSISSVSSPKNLKNYMKHVICIWSFLVRVVQLMLQSAMKPNLAYSKSHHPNQLNCNHQVHLMHILSTAFLSNPQKLNFTLCGHGKLFRYGYGVNTNCVNIAPFNKESKNGASSVGKIIKDFIMEPLRKVMFYYPRSMEMGSTIAMISSFTENLWNYEDADKRALINLPHSSVAGISTIVFTEW